MALQEDIALQELSKRIKSWRTVKALTQAEVADRMGLEDGNYRKFENGGNPTYVTLFKFCNALEIGLDDFFTSKV